MKVLVQGAVDTHGRVMLADVSPTDLRRLGTPAVTAGAVSVVLLADTPPLDTTQAEVAFEPSAATVLSVGRTSTTVFVLGGSVTVDGDEQEIENQKYGSGAVDGDDAFRAEVAELPSDLARAGERLLDAVRQAHGGYFQRTSVGRYVNRPNNWWTVKVQPRDKSLRITVRGRPSDLPQVGGLEIKPDQNGYSGFKMARAEQYDSVLTVLRAAAARSLRN